MKKASKFIMIILLIFVVGVFSSSVSAQEKVKLTEVVRSIFYAPQYVAMEKGYFTDEDLEIELSTAWGGDNAAAALMSNNTDIALVGPEPSIYIYNEGEDNYIVNFAQLTNTAGSFLVAREPMPDFSWQDLKGKEIIGNRPGGAPQMVLEYVLTNRNIDIEEDVNLVTNLDFTANPGAFAGGVGDFVQLFEPAASELEQEGKGYVVASFGEAGGNIPYTVYMARLNYLENNPDIIQGFTDAIGRAQLWVDEHSAEEIAEVVSSYFPDTEEKIIIKVIERYKDQNTWKVNPMIKKEDFNRYQEIMMMAGELEQKIDYIILVDDDFAGGDGE
ncbi:MAG: ABC transporter substrate-binding protein [Halanaerobiales bacterium]